MSRERDRGRERDRDEHQRAKTQRFYRTNQYHSPTTSRTKKRHKSYTTRPRRVSRDFTAEKNNAERSRERRNTRYKLSESDRRSDTCLVTTKYTRSPTKKTRVKSARRYAHERASSHSHVVSQLIGSAPSSSQGRLSLRRSPVDPKFKTTSVLSPYYAQGRRAHQARSAPGKRDTVSRKEVPLSPADDYVVEPSMGSVIAAKRRRKRQSELSGRLRRACSTRFVKPDPNVYVNLTTRQRSFSFDMSNDQPGSRSPHSNTLKQDEHIFLQRGVLDNLKQIREDKLEDARRLKKIEKLKKLQKMRRIEDAELEARRMEEDQRMLERRYRQDDKRRKERDRMDKMLREQFEREKTLVRQKCEQEQMLINSKLKKIEAMTSNPHPNDMSALSLRERTKTAPKLSKMVVDSLEKSYQVLQRLARATGDLGFSGNPVVNEYLTNVRRLRQLVSYLMVLLDDSKSDGIGTLVCVDQIVHTVGSIVPYIDIVAARTIIHEYAHKMTALTIEIFHRGSKLKLSREEKDAIRNHMGALCQDVTAYVRRSILPLPTAAPLVRSAMSFTRTAWNFLNMFYENMSVSPAIVSLRALLKRAKEVSTNIQAYPTDSKSKENKEKMSTITISVQRYKKLIRKIKALERKDKMCALPDEIILQALSTTRRMMVSTQHFVDCHNKRQANTEKTIF